jgi:hypothetical protein
MSSRRQTIRGTTTGAHMTTAPQRTLNNGIRLPAIGLGVFQAEPEDTVRAVEAALATGYRHIDTAASYGNEREVGEAIRRSGVDRDDVFIETKVWISDYGYDQTLHAFDKSAGKLAVEQIDLLILHQPLPTAFDQTIEAYKALEALLADDKVRAIGVSNFLPEYLESLLAQTEVVLRGARSTIRPSSRSPSATASRRPRSCCAGTSNRAAQRSPSLSSPIGSPRTSTSSTSSSTPTSSQQSTASTPACEAAPNPPT